MRYALLVYPGRTLTELPAADRQSVLDESEALVQAPGVVGAERLQPPESATTVRVEDGKTLTGAPAAAGRDDDLDGRPRGGAGVRARVLRSDAQRRGEGDGSREVAPGRARRPLGETPEDGGRGS